MDSLTKLKLKWVVISVVASLASWFLIMHGGVYGEAAQRSNEPTLIYQIEVWFGLLLSWPVTLYAWSRTFFGFSNILGAELFIFQFGGYAVLYKLHAYYFQKNT